MVPSDRVARVCRRSLRRTELSIALERSSLCHHRRAVRGFGAHGKGRLGLMASTLDLAGRQDRGYGGLPWKGFYTAFRFHPVLGKGD